MQADSYTWQGDIVHETEQGEDAPTIRLRRSRGALTVTVGDVDLPAFVSNGQLYIQAPLPLVFEAFAESLSDFIRDMEIGVSGAGGRSLSLDRDGRPVFGAGVAKPRVVRRGSKR
jgi:hypothetical protein